MIEPQINKISAEKILVLVMYTVEGIMDPWNLLFGGHYCSFVMNQSDLSMHTHIKLFD
jgi:hypothetical protein